MKIGGLQKLSTTDFPGRSAAVVYLQGCNMRCPYCYGRSLVVPGCYCEEVPEEKVFAFLERRQDYIDGVVITGGEPTIHRDLPEFASRIKALGYAIKLDTNGTAPDMLRKLVRLELLDYIAMDIKGPLNNYTQCSGVRMNPELIKASIWIIKNCGVEHEFRTTVVPGLHTVPELKEVANMIRGAKRYVLQEFTSSSCLRPEYQGRLPFDFEAIEEEREYFEKRVESLVTRSFPSQLELVG